MTRGQQTERGDAARRRIALAGERLFAERGLYGVSVRELARAAAMPTASLLHHFGTKEALYAAVLERIAADLDQVLAGALARPGPPRARLRRFLAGYLAFSQRHPTRSNLLLRELLDNPGRLERAARFPLAPVVDRIAGFLAEGRRAGAFRPLHPVVLIAHLAGSASYLAAAAPTFARIDPRSPPGALARAHARHLIAMLEHAVLRPEARP